MRYGLSLSGCILDMVTGVRNPDFVIALIAGTDYDLDNPYEVDRIVVEYTAPAGPWSDAPEPCEVLFRWFVEQKKIQQPRRTVGRIPDISNGRWADSIDDITWVKMRSTESDDTFVVQG